MKLLLAVLIGFTFVAVTLVGLAVAAEWSTLTTNGSVYYLTPDQADLDLAGGAFTISTRVYFTDTTQEVGWLLDKEGAYGFGMLHDDRFWYLRTQYGTSHITIILGPLTKTYNLDVRSEPDTYQTYIYVDGTERANISMYPWFEDNGAPLRVGAGLVAQFEHLVITQETVSLVGAQALTCRASWEFDELQPPYHDGCGVDNQLAAVALYWFPVIWK